jgi:hypothetical protein
MVHVSLVSGVIRKEGLFMSESESDRNITVTAQERAHPALRKLARACIALARQLVGEASSSIQQPPAPPASGTPTTEDVAASAEEQPDD